MNLAVIGSGGREHAICYKLKQSPKIKKLICLPGNAGIEEIAENVAVDISNFDLIYEILKKYKIDIVVVGPEQPLVDGFVNYLNEKKIRVFGPDKFCSQLEGSKAFMKDYAKKTIFQQLTMGFLIPTTKHIILLKKIKSLSLSKLMVWPQEKGLLSVLLKKKL